MTPAGLSVACALACLLATAPIAANDSIYTSVRVSDCGPAPPDVATAFTSKGLGVQQCPAPPGWRLYVVASDANTWIEVRSQFVTWSSETVIVYESPIGLFPTAAGAPRVEWRRRPDGALSALIFRVTAQQEKDTRRRVSRLFVVRLQPDQACLIDRVLTNDQARAVADGDRSCGPR